MVDERVKYERKRVLRNHTKNKGDLFKTISDGVSYSDSAVFSSLFNSNLRSLFDEFDPIFDKDKKKRPIIDPDRELILEDSRYMIGY